MYVEIKSPGCAPESFPLNHDESVLVGRRPDPGRAWKDAPSEALRTLAVPSPAVSLNHVVVTRDVDEVRVEDLGSRNGTWLRLPPRTTVTLPRSVDVTMHLAMPDDAGPVLDLPRDFPWEQAADFPSALVEQVEQWLGRRDLPARLALVAKDDRVDVASGRIPLATGHDLVIRPLGTVGSAWVDSLHHVERYVERQNVLFDCQRDMNDSGLVVASEVSRRVLTRVLDLAGAGARSLLLLGPTGCGKEGLARLFHRRQDRHGPFVAKNCSSFTADFARSELFGAERGSFTGSVQRLVGAVELAHEGTLFLDELGDLPLNIQPLLLRFLDRGEFERLGHRGPPSVADVRVVGATHHDLRGAASRGEFRSDLWYRLSAHVIEVPPLRERSDDLLALLKMRPCSDGRPLLEALSNGARELLLAHGWPGNFRELSNFADRAIVAARSTGTIEPESCRRLIEEGALAPPPPVSAPRVRQADDGDWSHAAALARRAFVEDSGGEPPRTWDDVKLYIESYLKPLLFAELAQLSGGGRNVDARRLVERLRADRGTVAKQLARYLDRFAAKPSE